MAKYTHHHADLQYSCEKGRLPFAFFSWFSSVSGGGLPSLRDKTGMEEGVEKAGISDRFVFFWCGKEHGFWGVVFFFKRTVFFVEKVCCVFWVLQNGHFFHHQIPHFLVYDGGMDGPVRSGQGGRGGVTRG